MSKENQIYVIYDQFHFGDPDHLERECRGWSYALANYNFLVAAYPRDNLGMTTKKEYLKLLESRKSDGA